MCTDQKYFIHCSNEIVKLTMIKNEWVEKYKPLFIIDCFEGTFLDFENEFLKTIEIYGIENVRATGSYSNRILSQTQKDLVSQFLRQQNETVKDKCFRCGRSGHTSYTCSSLLDTKLNQIDA